MEIAVLFLPGKAILIDIKDNNSVLGYSKQDSDGLYYIEDHQDEYPIDVTSGDDTVRTMMAIAKTENISTKE